MIARVAIALLALGGCKLTRADDARAVANLRPTHGSAAPLPDGGFRVTVPTFRAFAPGSSGDAATLRFTYRGPSASSRALASGQMRRQLGVKLRAADGCNLVYVMWRLEPSPGIEVSIKRNPGAHDHDDCGAGGYTKVAPTESSPAPPLAPGDAHALAARLDGAALTVTIDGAVTWRGTLPALADGLRGPSGVRTDNVAIDAVFASAASDQQ